MLVKLFIDDWEMIGQNAEVVAEYDHSYQVRLVDSPGSTIRVSKNDVEILDERIFEER